MVGSQCSSRDCPAGIATARGKDNGKDNHNGNGNDNDNPKTGWEDCEDWQDKRRNCTGKWPAYEPVFATRLARSIFL